MENEYVEIVEIGEPGKYRLDDLRDFVREHLRQKVNHGELGLAGFNLKDQKILEEELGIYEGAMLEGLVNGIIMNGGKVDGIK